MTTVPIQNVDAARAWLDQHCHRAEVRHVLLRSLEYLAAVERAGLCIEMIDGDDLYEFLTDPVTAAARTRALFEPTL